MKLREIFFELLDESIQLSDKLYFKTNKLSDKDREILMSITNGDNYSKFISDVILLFNNPLHYDNKSVKHLKEIYEEIKSYNKNFFPIIGLDDINRIDNISQIIYGLEVRKKLKRELSKLPSIAIRNLKNDIKEPRTSGQLANYLENFNYFMALLSYLDNKSDVAKENIYKKLFKNNTTLEQMTDFLDDKENLISGEEVTRESIIEVVDENPYDLSIVYDNRNYMIIKVESPEGIKSVGCNSLWCFTYGDGFERAYQNWYNYSTNDIVYVIVNFNEPTDDPDFMNVVIKPINFYGYQQYKIDFDGKGDQDKEDDDQIYNLFNEPQYDSMSFLKRTIGLNVSMRILTFDTED